MVLGLKWWKLLCIVLMLYIVTAGMLFTMPDKIPYIPKLKESVRNIFYHVPMWYVMLVSFLISAIYGIKYLYTLNSYNSIEVSKENVARTADTMEIVTQQNRRKLLKDIEKNKLVTYDIISNEFVITGIWFGILGMLTGMEWASVQWGSPWSNDPKQIGAGLTLLIYFAYAILRNSIKEESQRARIAAVYGILAFAMLIPLVYIIPAHVKSLHPGSDNKPFEALKTQAQWLRYVSIPAMFAWLLLGFWIADIRIRLKKLQNHYNA